MTLEDAASVSQVVLAIVATLAFGSAVYGIRDQRLIARKRAALDLFFKTELDRELVETYQKYDKAVDAITEDISIEQFAKTNNYKLIRSILNIHELVAVGIRDNVLDERVCFNFWGDELMDAYRNCQRIVEHARIAPRGTKFTYCDLERLNERWQKKYQRNVSETKRVR
jgi:hypothetical protein